MTNQEVFEKYVSFCNGNLSLFNIRCREYRSIYLFSSVRREYPGL